MNERWVSPSICVGLELEYEGVSSRAVAERYEREFSRVLLNFKNDGSLRPKERNTEITFFGPLSGSLIDEALDQVNTVLKWHKHRVSWRCGMHVHVDCRGVEFAQPYRAAVLSTMLEPVLYSWDGAGRQENKFCQSIVDSVYSYLPEARVRRRGDRGLPVLTKYSLINLKSLFGLGTLELRFAASTCDMNRAAAFINIGMGLREAAAPFPSSEALIVSMLEAPSPLAWIERHTHPLLAEQLAPVIAKTGFSGPSAPALNAAVLLAEYEGNIKHTLIGGQ